jgi:hypothetical protein
MFSNRMRRIAPFLLILALCLVPLTASEAGGIKAHSSKLVASQGILSRVGQLWQRMLSTWGQEGVTIDPSGGNPPANGNTGNGTTPTTPPVDPNNG